MQLIWNIKTSLSSVTLFKGNDPKYWIINPGAMTPLIVNGLFTVVSQEMLLFLDRHVPASITSHPITIYDRSSGALIDGYHRIYIQDKIDAKSADQLDKSGMKIWSFENSLSGGIFISNALMEELKKSDIIGLTYHRGFSCYG